MDMYQKREIRKKKNIEKSNDNTAKTNINWYIGTYSKITLNFDK